VQKEKMTTIMVTHNMEHALHYGNRLTMMHKGKIIVDIHQKKKSDLSVNDLVVAFERASGERFADDSIMLGNVDS
jgi:putative ABC transport system ATP-binding protein